jgi:FAD/FMN-containing dehydrogenase/Fe-S oxidoreductase
MKNLEAALKKELKCEVRFDAGTRAVYSTDSSNYRHVPIGVVFPVTSDDIITTIRICREFGAPILSRGGGTSLAGQSCNEAVMIETSKYYNQILEVDPVNQTATVQPGIVLDTLREAAKKHGLTFGPDPATHSRCTLGGMMGNNSCGVHSVQAGKTVDNVIELDIITYDGHRMTVGETSAEAFAKIIQAGGKRAEIYKGLLKIREEQGERIKAQYPDIPRRVSGYNLDQLLPENHFNVARALIGTEGTCVFILSAKLKLIPEPPKRGIVMLGFTDIFLLADAAYPLLAFHPIGLEAIDEDLIRHMVTKNLKQEDLKILPEGKSFFLFEIGGQTEAEIAIHAANVEAFAKTLPGIQGTKIVLDEATQKKMWEVREAGLGASALVPGQRDTWEGFEDSAVPPKVVGLYLRELKKLYDQYDYEGVLYGHFGDGCVHTRITFDLLTDAGIKKFRRFLDDAADLVVKYGGSISGEHGDGQSKAHLLHKMFGPELIRAFEEFKGLWDPLNKMNPGKVVHAHSPTEDLKYGTHYHPLEPETHFHYPEDQSSFNRATTRCVGVGACRNKTEGVMCPSYQATHEEIHSTRGRARLLFEMMRGEVIRDGWQSKEVKESLDLCLACKGCKSECPVNVDMATYKAEFLSHYYSKHLRPRMAWAMGRIYIWCRLSVIAPRLINWVMQNSFLSQIAKWLGGIHPKRKVPKFAPKTFRMLWKEKTNLQSKIADPSGKEEVLLWVDTFTNHFHPQIAEAAVRILEQAGKRVLITSKQHCCGRPLYDFGFLDQAKKHLSEILTDLAPEIRRGVPFVFLEPSCASVMLDELGNLFPHDVDAERLKKQSMMLSEYLVKHAPEYPWPDLHVSALVQGHCHHKSVAHFDHEKEALQKAGIEVKTYTDGCCGMAGAFGFSKPHYDVSQKIGHHHLFPALNAAPEQIILANGFSCREQIEQGSDRKVKHLAEILDPGV